MKLNIEDLCTKVVPARFASLLSYDNLSACSSKLHCFGVLRS